MNKTFFTKNKNSRKRGFSLLLGVLVGSLLISVGLGIFNLTFKESIISASGRESQFALYAADSGIECGLYYDVGVSTGGHFATSTVPGDIIADQLVCDGITPSLIAVDGGLNGGPYGHATTTLLYSGQAGTSCFEIAVGKHDVLDSSGTFLGIRTYVQSRGYNTCDTTNPRRVERGLYIKYGQ